MNTVTKIKKHLAFFKLKKLVIASLLVGFLSTFLALALKHITEHYEEIFFRQASEHAIYFVLFPLFGLVVIYFLRQYLFKGKSNKGITEIFESTQSRTKNLPLYKIPSHFINGFLTVIFGGSTGIEVSTVVASAAIGSAAQQKANFFRQYKTELICAGVAAGITALFSSPAAGILFALEVIAKKRTRVFFLSTILAVVVASALLYLAQEPPLFALTITTWHFYAIPYFVLLGVLAGMHSVYLTKTVLFFKSLLARIEIDFYRILAGAALLGVALLFLPQLYGDGYHAIKALLQSPQVFSLPFLILIGAVLLLKPVVTSATLAAGGDGGIFAPSLFLGAFLGLFTALILNTYLGAQVIVVNFVVLGMAAMLSASIHAPFTALFLVCGIVDDYTLFFPILLICLISKYTAKALCPYTVYTFQKN
ncbi:MAG TPA: chloride channel protein [Flavobacterium sp.]|nr:chloride channel protein [Flavobacterium sp.]HPJ10227.1 chloride channel protein [Flavobacterium sp.]